MQPIVARAHRILPSVCMNSEAKPRAEIRSHTAEHTAARKIPVPVDESHLNSYTAGSGFAARSDPAATGATGAAR
jgi:hypothetical protein